MTIPRGWEDALGVLAGSFHWPPESLWELTLQDVWWWLARARRLNEMAEEGARRRR